MDKDKRNIQPHANKEVKHLMVLLDKSQASEFKKMVPELQDTWVKKQMFRTETEMRFSVLSDNKYGFSGSRLSEFSLSLLFNKNNPLKVPISTNIVISHESEAFWNGNPAPNSENTIMTPGIGFFFSSNFATLTLNIQKPYYLNSAISEEGGTDYHEEAHVWQVSLSMRKILDYTIPWLYW